MPAMHPLVIHTLLHNYNICPHTMETIAPIRCHPSWHPQFTVYIAENKEAAISNIKTCVDDTQIFTDGSGYNGNAGGAAVLPKTGQVLSYKL